jgi:hypothetical protein
MALSDYIPNVFGQAAPSYLQGLLGAEETQNLQNRANVQGLLGAGLALAQGMSRTGPRRSAAENILGALSGGFGAAGGAYEQGVKNYVTQQQIAQTQLAQQDALLKRQQNQARIDQIKAIEKEDPALAQLLMLDPAEGAKQLALKQQLKLSGIAGQTGVETPESLRAQALKLSTFGPNFNTTVKELNDKASRLEFDLINNPNQQRPAASTASVMTNTSQPVLSADEKSLEQKTFVTPNPLFKLNQDRETSIARLARLRSTAPTDAITKAITSEESNLKRIEEDITRASSIDMAGDIPNLKKNAPMQFQQDFDFLESAIRSGRMTPLDVNTAVSSLRTRIENYNKEEKTYERTLNDFTKDAVRVGRQVAPGKNPKDYTDADFVAINKQLQQEAIARRPVTTINLSDPAKKAQALSENSSKYVQNKNVSESFEVATRFNNFVQAYNNPEAGGASDAVLIYSMAKMLDPGGAVQQGDIYTIAGQKSIPDKLKSFHQQFINTRSLSDDQRDSLNAMAYSLMNVKRKSLEPVIKQYRNYATALQSPDPTADVQDPFVNIQLPRQRVVTINGKKTTVRLGTDPDGVQGYYYTAPNGKTYPYQD